MKKSKYLTYQELQALAMQYYNAGGDSIVECWDESTFTAYCNEFGPMTKADALSMFDLFESERKDTLSTVW